MDIKDTGSEINPTPEVSPKPDIWVGFEKQQKADLKQESGEEKSPLDKAIEHFATETIREAEPQLLADNSPGKTRIEFSRETGREASADSQEKTLFKLRVEKNEGVQAQAYQFMREAEGGFSDNPHDRGGRTNKGVTQETYNRFRDQWGEKRQDVKNITEPEVERIYDNYWRSVKGDELPSATAIQMCDFGYNSGPGTAIKELQSLLKDSGSDIKCDGVIGPKTLSAVDKYVDQHGDKQLARELNDRRLDYLQGLKDWEHFGKGWTNRCQNLRKKTDEL